MYHFQKDVGMWMREVFPPEIISNELERAMRFFEEATELAQSLGMSHDQMSTMIAYTMARPVGEPALEVGQVMVTLAALCEMCGIDLEITSNAELMRINKPEVIKKIQAKQVSKGLFGIVANAAKRQPIPKITEPPEISLDDWPKNKHGHFICTKLQPMPQVYKNAGRWEHEDVGETDFDSEYSIEYVCKCCGHTWRSEMPD